MNCSTFRKKLYDYMEQNMTFDMREAMESHMKHCESCNAIYNEEKNLDDCFKEAFNINTDNFASSRSDIMRNIDKNRYSGNLINKLKYHLKRYRINYYATAAVMVIVFFTAPYVANMRGLKVSESTPETSGNNMMSKTEAAKDSAQQGMRSFAEVAPAKDNVIASEAEQKEKGVTFKTAQAPPADIKTTNQEYIPKFIITPADPKTGIKFGTPWKASPNGKVEVSIDGKGPTAGEEGIAQLLINDKASNNKWILSLTENVKQYTPKFVEWLNEENLLVIIGYSHGTVSPGGEIFKVNINTGSTELVYGLPSNREQVVSFKKGNNELSLQVVVYTDDNMNEYKTEQRTISYKMD
jgi:hypothetical protein